ncbi:MAG: DUF4249 domain-containing protein [Melioribacteraceae bacterium]|nr:DUF4249 domain-containing protein [Melioribacteraceae bacterium]
MIGSKIISLLIIIFFIVVSCVENVDPAADFREQYALNCVIRGDSTLQIARLFKSYPLNQLEDGSDPFLTGAEIRLWDDPRYNDKVYFFRDTLIERDDTARYNTPIRAYYIDDFKPRAEQFIEIEAILSDGKRLYSSTKTPSHLEFEIDYFIPPSEPGKQYIAFEWIFTEGERIVEPKLTLHYTKRDDNGVEHLFKKSLPTALSDEHGFIEEVYPKPTFEDHMYFYLDAIGNAIEDISKDDPQKNNYRILYAEASFLVYDKNLSSYYASSQNLLDDYTIRIDDIDFNNIEGGMGLFGSFVRQDFRIEFRTNYITSFGYLPGK